MHSSSSHPTDVALQLCESGQVVLSDEEIEEFYGAFTSFDLNNDNRIGLDEIFQVMQELGMSHFIISRTLILDLDLAL
jgi:Ca2+-binding EF-hand superfamily protein